MPRMPSNPFFFSTSSEKPKLVQVSFEDDPNASLGAKLCNHDKGLTSDMFMPSYTRIGKLMEGKTVARKAGVSVGDIVVAVNGVGFRRFPPDFQDHELEDVSIHKPSPSNNVVDNAMYDENRKKQKARTISGMADGNHYNAMLATIKEIKKSGYDESEQPLHLLMERYDWDSRVNSWTRFLQARKGNIPEAMKMMQDHEVWKASTFPIDLTDPGLQTVLKAKAVSEISLPIFTSPDRDLEYDYKRCRFPPTIYINFHKLQSIPNIQANDVSRAFVIFAESLLKQCSDPRHPRLCQLIDLTGVSVGGGLRSDILRDIYSVFEPNYPETLEKMIFYPVTPLAQSTTNLLLSFVNENTRKKFVMTDHLGVVCHELGWDSHVVSHCGSIEKFVKKHSKAAAKMVFDD